MNQRIYPASLGYEIPAEWSLQEAIWLSWPVTNPQHWGGKKHQAIQEKFAQIAASISWFETVRINAPQSQHAFILQLCNQAKAVPERIELFNHPHNDVWCRDHGPIFIKQSGSGKIALTDWQFNAWGGKFPPWDEDNAIPQRIAETLNIERFSSSMILEGGAIETNGAGQLLTTEAVLLNPNRNPEMSVAAIEQELKLMLGIKEVLWLKQGIEGDDTDGHIDDLARFCDETTILACLDKNSSSANFKVLEDNLNRLKAFKSLSGKAFDIATIPLPEACEVPGWRLPVLPASYVNFLILNDAVLVPTFLQKKNDERALGIIQEMFPTRKVIGIDCLDLVEEGGTLHCISQQQPA